MVESRSQGRLGAAATGHPAATGAATRILARGGSAVDAAIAAQAVIATVMPQAAGLGGDMLALVREPAGGVFAVNGTGRSAVDEPPSYASDGGSSVTVPGLVDAWSVLHRRWGRLPMIEVLSDALRFARDGYRVDEPLARATRTQRTRIEAYGGGSWPLLAAPAGTLWKQPEVARLLGDIGLRGSGAFYGGAAALAIARAVAREGGTLSLHDLAAHSTEEPPIVETEWNGGRLIVQPPSSQGILLAMAARWVQRMETMPPERMDHVLIEVTEASFAHRSDAAGPSEALLALDLAVDIDSSSGRGGPRAYLHTAGAAVADSEGMVVSSLVSVFDDFGSGVFVPELGLVLNNRAAGFTDGANAPGPGRRPVHTLAPAMVVDREGWPLALATPGADGQVQTLLQVLTKMRFAGATLDEAVAAPRWRSEAGNLLIERGHPAGEDLRARGHCVLTKARGDDVFGAVVAAGLSAEGAYATADWRRTVSKGTA